MASTRWISGEAEGSLGERAGGGDLRMGACSKDFRDGNSLKDMDDEEAKDPGGRGTGRPLYLAVESARSPLCKTKTQKTRASNLQRTRASDWRSMDDYKMKG